MCMSDIIDGRSVLDMETRELIQVIAYVVKGC